MLLSCKLGRKTYNYQEPLVRHHLCLQSIFFHPHNPTCVICWCHLWELYSCSLCYLFFCISLNKMYGIFVCIIQTCMAFASNQGLVAQDNHQQLPNHSQNPNMALIRAENPNSGSRIQSRMPILSW